jgi:hypothetical protein
VLYLAVSIASGAGLYLIGASWPIKTLAGLLIALLAGFEASSLWRWTLTRRGWKTVGFVVADDEEAAERRFFAEWTQRANDAAPSSAPAEPLYTTPVRRGPPSGADVIGLFPEPGA